LARRSPANRNALRALLKPETTIWQYTHDAPDPALVSPDGYSLDNYYLARPGADDVQLDLFGDYKAKVALYPAFQSYFRTHKPPLLAARGKKTPSFFRRAPRLSNATFPTPSFAFSTPATSRWRPTLQRSHPPYATFFPAESPSIELRLGSCDAASCHQCSQVEWPTRACDASRGSERRHERPAGFRPESRGA
jgi:hypothetical protein